MKMPMPMKTRIFFMPLLCCVLTCAALLAQPLRHDYLHNLYDALHDSPMQRKFRQIAPMPFGVVFLPWAGCTEADMRKHFRMMKELGFTNLKQTMGTPEWPEKEVLRIALEEGIIPFWYGEGGWEPITPELLKQLKIPAKTPMAEIRKHPAMLAHQQKVFYRHLETWKTHPGEKDLYNHIPDAFLRPADIPLFRDWVRRQYPNIQALARAWNQYEVGITSKPYKSWDDFDNDPLITTIPGTEEIVPSVGREYGKVRDILRFKADMYIENVKKTKALVHPEQPQRAGGEMGLFLPFASRGTDMEGIAETMAELGSFYPSIHLAWHFEETQYEVARCIYMQSSIGNDWFKGGWAATWESTGGPQQFSGGKGWDLFSGRETAGYTVNGGTMTQLLLSYLAGGYKGVGLWAWNYRNAGWESGEYALLNRQNEPGERAIKAGQIAKASDRYRDELWAAHKEPEVGVLVNWDNEAIWAANSGPNRTHFKHYPIQARIGISRALINANVPWEHVTPKDLKKGLGPRYKVIYMPAQAAINEDLLPLLDAYVQQGGRLVLDAPGAWWDERGRVLKTGKGSAFEKIFGVAVADFQYANNVAFKLGSYKLSGFVLDLQPTTAVVKETFHNGMPAVTENRYGKGTAVILAVDAAYAMKAPGEDFLEKWTVQHMLGSLDSPYACEGAIVFRLAAPGADHYFFINDEEAKSVRLKTRGYAYRSVTDAITGEKLELGAPISLEAFSGRWLRFAY
jgi:beta-galactosidase